jgi:RimJ/RimL family protein N-acetyltransferase
VAHGLGYSEDRRQRFWELDLKTEAGRLHELAETSRARMRQEGIQLLTIAQDPHPDKYRQTHATSAAAEQDVPTTGVIVPDSFEHFMRWLENPTLHQDRFWIARDGEEVVGLSNLSYPTGPGIVQTDWTGVARAHRNRGVARALKLETVLQALELGVDRVRTDNDWTNVPILHLNEELGYRLAFEKIWLIKKL